MSARFGPKGRGHDATGRTKKQDDPHFRLYRWFADLPAWRDLSPAARCVYLEIELCFNGVNNGQIGMSGRTAATRCNIARDTAHKALHSLVAHGFIECLTPGGFSTNACKAPEWRLTRAPCDVTRERPSRAFKTWTKGQNLGLETAERRPKRGPVLAQTDASLGEKSA